MALITCPECGKEFSDRATACPNCGCPTSAAGVVDESLVRSADNAFYDGRYDEAYEAYNRLYLANDSIVGVNFKLAISTAGKDGMKNGVPNSTKKLITSGLELLKAASDDAKTSSDIVVLLKDAQKLTDDIRSVVSEAVEGKLSGMSSTRSAKRAVFDSLFADVTSARMMNYQDTNTLNQNINLLEQAKTIRKNAEAHIQELGSFLVNAVVGTVANTPAATPELTDALQPFVSTPQANEEFQRLNASGTASAPKGLCFGEEVPVLDFSNTFTALAIGDKMQNRGGFAPPRGRVVVTNYKITYNTDKSKTSFTKSLDNLTDVGAKVFMGAQYLKLSFSDSYEVWIQTVPANAVPVFIAELKAFFNM